MLIAETVLFAIAVDLVWMDGHVQLKGYSASLVNEVLWELLIRNSRERYKTFSEVLSAPQSDSFSFRVRSAAGTVINFSLLNLIASPGTNNVISSLLSASKRCPDNVLLITLEHCTVRR